MSENPAYFAIIPSAVRYCKDISANEKLMYGEITALTQKEGYCWATNKYFSELYGVSKRTVSRWINNLVKHGFIENDVTFINGTSMVDKRYIRLKGMDTNVIPHDNNVHTPHDNNVHTLGTIMSRSNSTSLNNTSSNIPPTPQGDECEKKSRKEKETIPPTLDEVRSYCRERKNGIDPEAFIAHYETTGWMRGKNKIKSWKACVRTWEKNRKDKPQDKMPTFSDNRGGKF